MPTYDDFEVEFEEVHHSSVVRPYLMTNGRTQADGPPVFPETIVVARDLALAGVDWLTFERQSITKLAVDSQSVAELSAQSGIPLGAMLILVSDMVNEGLLTPSESIRTAGVDILHRIRVRLEKIGK
jgi:hypothetical protein